MHHFTYNLEDINLWCIFQIKMLKPRKHIELILISLSILVTSQNSFCQNMKFKINRGDIRVLCCSRQIAEWKVRSNIHCHTMCARNKRCVKVQYDNGLCKAYGDKQEAGCETYCENTLPHITVSEKVCIFLPV